MGRVQKMISVILVLSMILTLSGTAAWGSAVDREKPEVNSISILNPGIESGAAEKLQARFDIVEEGIGVIFYTGSVENLDTGKEYEVGGNCLECHEDEPAHYCFTGKHTVEFDLSALPAGTYQFNEIYVMDDGGNTCEIFNPAKVMTTENSFSVAQGIEKNVQQIKKIEVGTSRVTASGTLKLNVTLGKKASHNVQEMAIVFREKGTDYTVRMSTPTFPRTSGAFCAELPAKNGKFRNADYYVQSLTVYYDNAYGSITYSMEDVGLTESDTFTVTGSSVTPDYTSPKISRISFSGSEASIPGAWNGTVQLQEEGSGVNEIVLGLRSTETGELMSLTSYMGKASETPVRTGTYQCAFPVYRTKNPGTYELISLQIADKEGNFTEYDVSSGVFAAGTTLKITSPYEGKLAFSVSLSHTSLMNQVSSLQPGETGLIDISGVKVVPAGVFRAAAGKDVTLIFDFAQEYQWIVSGLDIDSSKCKDVDMEVHYALTDGMKEGFSTEDKVLKLQFRDNGTLPGKMTFRVQAAYLYGRKGFSSEKAKLYYLQGDKITAEKTEVLKEADGAMEFELTHNSDFAVTAGAPSLGKVKNLTAKASGMSTITVSWEKNGAATGYYIYRSTSGRTGTFKKIATVKTASYTDKKLTAGKKYYYKVKPYNSKRSSINHTARTSGSVSENTRLAAPKLITAGSTARYRSSIYLTWKSSSGASKYYVYRSTSLNGTYKRIAVTSKTYYNDKTAQPVKQYYYKIRAVHPKYSKYNSLLGVAKSARIAQYRNGVITKI